jgi:hypothetical protein
VTDRTLRDLLDARLDPTQAERAVDALPPAQRAEARALLAIGRAAAGSPPVEPSPEFAALAMSRVRATRPPRLRLLDRLLRVPQLAGGVAVAAGAVFLALAVVSHPARPPADAPPPPALDARAAEIVRARLALVAPGARDVRVAGDFNGWRPDATPLARDGEGRWQVEVPVARGRRYAYMFLVDGAWVTDPSAPAHADDGFGGQNAILDT